MLGAALQALDLIRPVVRNWRGRLRAAQFGQPNGEMSVGEYAAWHPELWRPVEPSFAATLPPPGRFGPNVAEFLPVLPSPELGLLMVPDGLVRAPHGWVFTRDHQFLTGCAWPAQEAGFPRKLPQNFIKGRRLSGTCLNLASDWGSINYGHFVFDSIARFSIFQRSGFDLKAVDHIYCPVPDSALTRDLMERLGIPLEKCIWVHEEPQITADLILATTFPGSRYNYPPSLLKFLRQARGKTGTGSKRIYVPRGKIRNISNEAEILEIARAFDFSIYDFSAQAGHEVFADAEIVIGPHGAGLTNAVFAKPNAAVLEIIPSDSIYPFFYAKTEAAGMHYSYLLAPSEEGPRNPHFPSHYNFWVDPVEFRKTLARLTSEEHRQRIQSRRPEPVQPDLSAKY